MLYTQDRGRTMPGDAHTYDPELADVPAHRITDGATLALRRIEGALATAKAHREASGSSRYHTVANITIAMDELEWRYVRHALARALEKL
jgi:hypothetical protein